MTRALLINGIISCLFFVSCGVKGPLQPPLILVPQGVQKIDLSQRGAMIVLTWETPLAYENGISLSSLPSVEIWSLEIPFALETEKPSFPGWDEFSRKGHLVAEVRGKEASPGASLPPSLAMSWEYPIEVEKLERTVVFFSFRVRDERGRKSSFSEPVAIIPLNVPGPPENLQANLQEDRVVLRWRPAAGSLIPGKTIPPDGYNIYRKQGNSPWICLNPSPVQTPEYEDLNVNLEQTYDYQVRAVRLADSWRRESEASAVFQAIMKDIFPPAPPSGLTFVISSNAIALSWEPNGERDLAGYRVWRRAEEETEYTLLTPQPILETSFEDRAVEKGKRYHYAISACDRAGNESRRTEISTSVVRPPDP